MYGHVHMAKTGGTSLNRMLANNFERVYANESAKCKGAMGISVAVSANTKYGRDQVVTATLGEMGFKDHDYISHEV
ncbi:hypothetical protein ACHAWF_001796 [Thalassiosira exigua]